ncbi:hypothetical protein H257_18685, partial [Aphanomyces astaci]
MFQLKGDARPTNQDLTSNFRRDMIAGCGQRPGRGGGSLGALPRCSSAPASLSADLRSIVYSIHVRRTSEPNAAFAFWIHAASGVVSRAYMAAPVRMFSRNYASRRANAPWGGRPRKLHEAVMAAVT